MRSEPNRYVIGEGGRNLVRDDSLVWNKSS